MKRIMVVVLIVAALAVLALAAVPAGAGQHVPEYWQYLTRPAVVQAGAVDGAGAGVCIVESGECKPLSYFGLQCWRLQSLVGDGQGGAVAVFMRPVDLQAVCAQLPGK